MSWGERSCGHYAKGCTIDVTELPCNVDCKEYIWDGITLPDTKPSLGTAIQPDAVSLTSAIKGYMDAGNPRHLNRAQRRALVKQRKKARGRR